MLRAALCLLGTLVLGGCGKLHYVSPELASEEDPKAVHLLFPFYTHAGYHRIDHLNLERINDVDMRGYAGAVVPAGTYRLIYDCQMEKAGEPIARGDDRVKTLILKPGHSYLLRTGGNPANPGECQLTVRYCAPGQQIRKQDSRYLRDAWGCRSG